MSPASQSLLKFATLQLTDFNGFALSLPEPLINVTISAPISEPPPTFVQWCLLTCDAFRDLSHLPFLHQSCWNMRRMCWTSCPAVHSFPNCLLQKNPKIPSPAPFVVGSLQHSPSTGHRLRAGTSEKAQGGFARFSKENLHCSVTTDTGSAHFAACSAGTHKL